MGISSAGVGSGLDLESIINSLMAIEKRPLQKLEQQKKNLDTQVSDLGKIKNALSNLKEKSDAITKPEFFNTIKATGSDDTVGRVTVNGSAVAGTYNVSVSNIAQSRVDSLDVSMFSQDPDGNLLLPEEITVAGTRITLGAAPVAMSVEDLVGKINTETGSKLSASLVKSSGGDKIVFTAKQSGATPGYSDSDFAGCQDSKKSTSSYIYLLAGGAISWKSVKQTLAASSTMAAVTPYYLRAVTK